MLRTVFFLILFYVLYRLVRFLWLPGDRGKAVYGSRKGVAISDEMVKDPFCEVYVPKGQSIKERVDGQTYYFCSKDCLKGFKKRLKESNRKG